MITTILTIYCAVLGISFFIILYMDLCSDEIQWTTALKFAAIWPLTVAVALTVGLRMLATVLTTRQRPRPPQSTSPPSPPAATVTDEPRPAP